MSQHAYREPVLASDRDLDDQQVTDVAIGLLDGPGGRFRALQRLRTTMREVHLRRTGRDLLSRTADNLYWLGRYGERAEGTMRLLRSVLSRFLEDGRPDSNPLVLQRLLRLQLRLDPTAPAGDELPAWDAVERLVGTLMYEAGPYALRDSLDQLQRTATLVRDQISHDAWRMLNALHIDRRWRQPRRRIAMERSTRLTHPAPLRRMAILA